MKNLILPFAWVLLALPGACGGSATDTRKPQGTAPAETPTTQPTAMYPALTEYLQKALAYTDSIPAERKQALAELATYVREQQAEGAPARLVFICTHNSRRSHISQLWAATAAAHYGLDHVHTYSGGTEATAFNPRAVAAMERAGFAIENPGGENPRYRVRYAEQGPEMVCFSKKYDDDFNPQENFAAVMTCSQADKACPVVHGASVRVAIPYEDPKAADGTSREAATYDERAFQIATEMLYLMGQV